MVRLHHLRPSDTQISTLTKEVYVIEILRKNNDGSRRIDYAQPPGFESGAFALRFDPPLHDYKRHVTYVRDRFYGMRFTANVEYQLVHPVPEPVDPDERAEARALVRERRRLRNVWDPCGTRVSRRNRGRKRMDIRDRTAA